VLKDPASSSRLLGLVAAVASALMLFAAGEPAGIGPLAWVALVPLFVAVLRERRPVWSWLYGLAFGLAFFGIHLSWIFIFGWMAWTALVATLAVYTSAATFLAGVLRRSPLAPLVAAGAWAGIEVARDRWPFGGFPWGAVGTTQATVPGVRWLAGVVGAYGLSFLVVFVAAFVAHRIVSGGWSLASLAVVGGALAVFVAVDTAAYGPPPPGRPLRVLVVQGGVPRPALPNQRDVILDSHIRLTKELMARSRPKPDVVVWPEDSIGVGVRPTAESEVEDLARSLHTPFLVGRSVVVSATAFHNTVEHITADGARDGVYVKRHPVPFGEYVPLGFFRHFVSTLNNEVPYDLKKGRTANVFDVGPAKLATPICFESVFPRDILDFARNGADLYVLSTNNASFSHSYAAQQHLAHARMRALETRQWFVQAALSGPSAEVRPDGRVLHTTKLFTSAAFVADVRTRPAHSLYAKTGDLFAFLFALLTLAETVRKKAILRV
jgi:apolipoprotein N-acyltransferase